MKAKITEYTLKRRRKADGIWIAGKGGGALGAKDDEEAKRFALERINADVYKDEYDKCIIVKKVYELVDEVITQIE